MKIFAGIVGILLFLVGLLIMVGGLIGSRSVNITTYNCANSTSSNDEDCSATKLLVDSQSATAFTVGGAAMLISGAVFIGGAVAAPRKFVQLGAPQQPMMPVGPPR